MIAEVMKMREEEKKQSSPQRFFKKRWVYPAIYIASAAIILTAVFWFQSNNNDVAESPVVDSTDVADGNFDQDAVEVNRPVENFVMPVTNPDTAVIAKPFYDLEGKKEEQEAALVFYNNTYHPNTGIDIALKDGESFEVVAALSGTVTKVEEDALLGNVIEVEHEKGIVTQYQSIQDIKVEVGEFVEQGQALAAAGQSLFNEEAGVHVHFEIRKDSIAVNPLDYFNKPLSALQEAELEKENATTNKEENKAADEQETGAQDDAVNNQEESTEDADTQSNQTEDQNA